MFGMGSVWGLDLAETGLKAVKMRREGSRLLVEDFAVVRYADLTTDTEVRKEDLLRLALRQVLPRLGKAEVVAGIPSENVLSRFISLPPVERRRIRDIVQYEARQQIPFDLNEVLWDYQVVQKEFVPGEEIDIGLFAVRREHINGYLDELRSLGGALRGLQTSPLAVYNFIREDVAPEKPVIAIDIGARTTDLIVIEGDKFWMRNLRVAGNTFTQAIQKKFNISFDDAENVKRHMARSKYRTRIFEVVQTVAQELVSEIQRSIGYYKSLSREARFDQILVLGNGLQLSGLQRFMEERLQYSLKAVDALQSIDVIEPRRAEFEPLIPGMASALGLAMQGLGRSAVTVQLLPEEFIIRSELGRKKIPALAGAVLLWIAFGALWLSKGQGLPALGDMRNIGSAVLQESRAKRTEFDAARQVPDISKAEALLALQYKRDIWGHVIKGITEAVPPYIYISGLTFGPAPVGLAEAAAGATSPGAPGAGPAPTMPSGPVSGAGGMPPMGPGGMPAEAGAAVDTGMQAVQFYAYTDARNEPTVLTERLKESLLEAEVFPERVKLFKTVYVPGRQAIQVVPKTEAGFTVTAADPRMAVGRLIRIQVICELRPEQELWAERDKVRGGQTLPTTPD